MKTKLLISVISLINLSAFAEESILCKSENLSSPKYSAEFVFENSTYKVKLDISSNQENTTRSISGECIFDKGAIELATTCNVMNSTDSGYEVRLYSIGGATLYSSVTPWSMKGKGERINLSCEN